jgi:hypothetical protein
MNKTFWAQWLESFSDNLKSKIENLKSVGLAVIAFVLLVAGAGAQPSSRRKSRG